MEFFKRGNKLKFPPEYLQAGWDQQLLAIYNQLVTESGTVAGNCEPASTRVSERIGWPVIVGFFLVDPWGLQTHFWNLDPQGRIVELTGQQFNNKLWPWNKLPKGPLVIDPQSSAGRRYLRYSR